MEWLLRWAKAHPEPQSEVISLYNIEITKKALRHSGYGPPASRGAGCAVPAPVPSGGFLRERELRRMGQVRFPRIVSAAVTTYDLATGQAARMIPLRRSRSPSTTTGLSARSGRPAYTTLA